MKYEIKSLYLVVFTILLPTILGSSNSEFDYSKDIAKTEIPSIISSVPKGLPIDPKKIKCHIPHCSGFGMRYHPIFKTRRKHNGIDFPAKLGTNIVSTSYGTVIRSEYHRSYGNVVEVKSGIYTARYAHCKDLYVKVGDKVKMGQVIATVGSSGLSTGPHCHYEIDVEGKKVNPFEFIQ